MSLVFRSDQPGTINKVIARIAGAESVGNAGEEQGHNT